MNLTTRSLNPLFACLLLFANAAVHAQEVGISGDWQGQLQIPTGQSLLVVLHLQTTEQGMAGTMDSPQQGALGLRMSKVEFADNKLHFELNAPKASYQGELNTESAQIAGTFSMNGTAIKLNFVRSAVSAKNAVSPSRPQTPVAPFPYRVEEVRVTNPKAKLSLAGSLTMPSSAKAKAVAVLITGSGSQDRDESMLGHKPFLVLADYLTRQGYAVLRLDDRGIGGSGGDAALATSADFVTDMEAAIDYLQQRNDLPRTIGLIGHSEGGLIAQLVAANHAHIAFVISLAGPGLPSAEMLAEQNVLIAKAMGNRDSTALRTLQATARTLFESIAAVPLVEPLPGSIKGAIHALIQAQTGGASNSAAEAAALTQLSSPWYRYFLTYQPAQVLPRVRSPYLALNGSLDVQVAASSNLTAINNILGKAHHSDFTTRELAGLNHLFQTAATGSPIEYEQITETFAPAALTEIGNWLNQRFGR
jgi:uncharacterized protein